MKKHEMIIAEVEKIIPEVYLVGGSVRDLILGLEPHDYDFTTPLSPDEIESLIKNAGRKSYAIGKKFGTIGFKVQADDGWHYVEVTTFRTEQYDGKSRKPQVEFVDDLLLDLSRRDFTINAIALHNGEFIDPFGGRLDILERKIKAVGNGKDRFNEDPLRMLRAARFVSKLNFNLDPNLIGDMRKCSTKILNVSKERWVIELDKILTSGNSELAFKILNDGNVLRYILPEINLLMNNYSSLCSSNLILLDELQKENQNSDLAWKQLLSIIGLSFSSSYNKKYDETRFPNYGLISRELSIGICHRLKFSNQRIKTILS